MITNAGRRNKAVADQFFAQLVQNHLFPPGYLHLGHAQLVGGDLLGLPLHIPQRDEHSVARLQFGQHLPQRQPIGEIFFRRRGGNILHLAVVLVAVAGERHRRQRRAQRFGDLLARERHLLRQLAYGGLAPLFAQKRLAFPRHPHGQLFECAPHLDGAAFAEQSPNLAQDHRHRIGGKPQPARGVKAVGSLDQSHASRLKQVVIFHPAPHKSLAAGVHQPHVAADVLVAISHGHPPADPAAVCIFPA